MREFGIYDNNGYLPQFGLVARETSGFVQHDCDPGFSFGFRLQSREMRNAAFEASWCLRMVSRHIRGSSSDIAAS